MNTTEASKINLFLVRGLAAIAWSVVFAATSGSLTTAVTVGAAVLVVIYPLIDVVGSLIDARSQDGSARRLLLGDAVVSTVAAVALAVAATGGVASVIAVFGAWALVSGAAQLATALRRRAQLGTQWPMVLAGGVSTIAGVAYIIASGAANPSLMMLVIYTAAGGIDFVLQAWLLARRRHLTKTADPILSAS